MAASDSTLAGLGINRYADTTTPRATGRATMGQDDFLALMTAQLKNQDPFEPVDNTQMVAQMAQFSSLAGITEMASTLKAIAGKLGATSASDALAWVGRTVLTEGDVAYARSTGGIEGVAEIDADATNVTVTITDADGAILKTIDLGAREAGAVAFDWDGKTADGEDAGDGPFHVGVTARNGDESVAARSYVWAPVASVSLSSGGEPVLNLPGIGQVPASAVLSIG